MASQVSAAPKITSMTLTSFDQFAAAAKTAGFDEVLERQWAADTVLDTHTHPFDVKAQVVAGEFWLTLDEQTRHLQVGDEFTLARDIPHAERYGPNGATYWVARKN
jgi:hypothetical protein